MFVILDSCNDRFYRDVSLEYSIKLYEEDCNESFKDGYESGDLELYKLGDRVQLQFKVEVVQKAVVAKTLVKSINAKKV